MVDEPTTGRDGSQQPTAPGHGYASKVTDDLNDESGEPTPSADRDAGPATPSDVTETTDAGREGQPDDPYAQPDDPHAPSDDADSAADEADHESAGPSRRWHVQVFEERKTVRRPWSGPRRVTVGFGWSASGDPDGYEYDRGPYRTHDDALAAAQAKLADKGGVGSVSDSATAMDIGS